MAENPFANLQGNILSRDFGGSKIGTAEPYITGYQFIWFESIPSGVIDAIKSRTDNITDEETIQRILAASALSVTTPGGRLNKIEFTGLGGIKWGVPGNIDYDTAVSIKFLEFQETPIFDIFHSWVQIIRDYRTGVSGLNESTLYNKTNYSTVIWYFTTTPDMGMINYCACYDGCFPVTDPQQSFAGDVENIGKLELEIEFNVDYIYTEPWVFTHCENTLLPYFTGSYGTDGIKSRTIGS